MCGCGGARHGDGRGTDACVGGLWVRAAVPVVQEGGCGAACPVCQCSCCGAVAVVQEDALFVHTAAVVQEDGAAGHVCPRRLVCTARQGMGRACPQLVQHGGVWAALWCSMVECGLCFGAAWWSVGCALVPRPGLMEALSHWLTLH